MLKNKLWACRSLLLAISTLFFVGLAPQSRASHNLAGEITLKSLGGGQFEITLTTYTDPSAAFVDRCEAEIEIWGGLNNLTLINTLGPIRRQNGPPGQDPNFPPVTCPNGIGMGEYLFPTIKKNVYRDTTTLNPGYYTFRYFDPARVQNVINMDLSGSLNFFIETRMLIAENYLGPNNTVEFLNHPIDFACTGRLWTHNPGGYDVDGDSLVYSLIPCQQYNPPFITSPIQCYNYQFPSAFGPGTFTIDSQTGLITWDVPTVLGIYNVAILVREYRNGQLINYVIRDMAIFVQNCNNQPPIIDSVTDTCVTAGDTLIIDFVSYDPNFPTDSLYFFLNNNGSGNNGPFSVPISPATITFIPAGPPPIETHGDTVRGTIRWITDCSHVRPQFYQVDFYAHDNIDYYQSPGNTMLSAHHVIKIWVKPPPVTGLTATPGSRSVTLSWDPHPCPNVEGYNIYRNYGGGFSPDSVCCEGTPDEQGFELIGTTTHRDSVTFFDDNNGEGLSYGVDICYVVVALFPDMMSCPSEEICVNVTDDHAILTQDSIDITDNVNGSIFVSWKKPTQIDTLFFPTPFTYTVNRAPDISGPANFAPIASGIAFNDTTLLDSVGTINTLDLGYRYRVDVYDANNVLIANGNRSSSVYLDDPIPGDQQLTLFWSEFTDWANSMYYVYRADIFGGPYVLIDSVVGTGANTHFYVDDSLTNFEDYCYYILSKGSYAIPGIKDPLFNASEKKCGIPVDLTPPCISQDIFDTLSSCVSNFVRFDWFDPDSLCAGDIDYYSFYVQDRPDGPRQLVDTVHYGGNQFIFDNQLNIANCYSVTATDTLGNESEPVTFCFESCPEIDIGNVFSPNGDGINDWFGLMNPKDIVVTHFFIYDRWGHLVYSVNNPANYAQLWDGKTSGGAEAHEGVYYYVIYYNEIHLKDDVLRPGLAGHVTLLR